MHDLPQIPVCGGNKPHIHQAFSHISETAEGLLFEHLQEFWLDLKIQVSDFVQEDGPLMPDLQQAHFVLNRSSERSFFVAKKFRLQEFLRKPGTVQIHEWPL